MSPIPLRARLSEFDVKVLAGQRFPAVVGILSSSRLVIDLVREAVRAGAGPDVGVVGAVPGDGAAMRRVRAHATMLAWDAITASDVPRIQGRRHLLIRLVPGRFVSDLLDLLGSRNTASRRFREGTDRIRAGPASHT